MGLINKDNIHKVVKMIWNKNLDKKDFVPGKIIKIIAYDNNDRLVPFDYIYFEPGSVIGNVVSGMEGVLIRYSKKWKQILNRDADYFFNDFPNHAHQEGVKIQSISKITLNLPKVADLEYIKNLYEKYKLIC